MATGSWLKVAAFRHLVVPLWLLSSPWAVACAEGGDGGLDRADGQVDVPADSTADSAADAEIGGEAGQDSAAEAGLDAPADAARTPTPFELAGWVRVVEDRDGGGGPTSSRVEAELLSGPMPTSQKEVARAGECALFVGELSDPWLCRPECTFGQSICIDGECVPFPAPAPSGRLTISGLAKPVALTPDGSGRYPGVYELPLDLFPEGGEVRLESDGGATPALDLVARGVHDFRADLSGLDIREGKGTIRWDSPPAGTEGTRVFVLMQTGWHGSPNLTTIWCDAEDDGELVVAPELLEEFPIPSCGECEASYIGRYTIDVKDFGFGPIELMVASRQWFVAWW